MSRGQQQAPATKSPEPTAEEFTKAAEYEQAIATEAVAIRGEATTLDAGLFMKLYPLLCKPIPAAYIQKIGVTTGKPYESTGIRSVQVQIDRMNNVLTPLWWHDLVDYEDGGKLAKVTVVVGDGQKPDHEPLVVRSSRGGVGQGSGAGNIYKGSYTNAAKIAFARLGPGHEVYLGAADLDPDVNQEVAEQAPPGNAGGEQKKNEARIGIDVAGDLFDRASEIKAAEMNLRLSVSHILGRDIGDLSDRERAIGAFAEELTFDQAERLSRWIEQKKAEAEAKVADGGSGE